MTEQHAVFERALHIAVRRLGGVREFDARDPALVDDAKVYFYEAFRRGYRGFQGDGQFFAYLYGTLLNFVREQVRRNRRGSVVSIPDDEGEDGGLAVRAVQQWQQENRTLDPVLQARLGTCLLRLPDHYRSVVLMHHFEGDEQLLQDLAPVLGATAEAIHKRYQRAIAMLRECLSQVWS